MSISALPAVLLSSTVAVLIGAPAPALAPAVPAVADVPLVVSAELAAAGDGCGTPALQLSDGFLDVRADTGGDASLLLHADEATAVECVVDVRLTLDRPGTVKPAQYLMSGLAGTPARTSAGHWFESSFDGVAWHGQRTTLPAGSVGGFYRGGGSALAPASACGTEVDLSFRVGLSLDGPGTIALDASGGAVAELRTVACAG